VYQVIRRDPAGTLTVAVVDPGAGRADRGNRVMLPAEYVAVHVELEYAGTSHAAQGGTRFSSHALISERDSTSAVYVDLTRGRVSNVAHVDSEIPANDERPPTSEDPVAVLARVFNREDPGEALPAIEAQELAATNARSLRTLFPIWQDLDGQHAVTRWRRALAESQGEEFAAAVTEAAAWPTLAARLGVIEAGGGDPVDALRAAVASRTLGDAGDVAAWCTTGSSRRRTRRNAPAGCTPRSRCGTFPTRPTRRPCARWRPAWTDGSPSWARPQR